MFDSHLYSCYIDEIKNQFKGVFNIMQLFDEQQFLKDLENLVNISGTAYVSGVERVATFFKNEFEKLGWNVRAHNFDPSVGPCLEISNTTSSNYDVMLLGHMDTVFPEGTASERPFKIEDGKAFGPGVVDMKSGCLFALYAAKVFQKCDKVPSICVAFNSHEEVGSKFARKWIEDTAAKSKNVIVLEPARANGNLVNQRKGIGRYTVDILGKAAHAGVEPEKGISATQELAHWILEIHKLSDPKKGTNLNAGCVTGGTAANVVPEKAQVVFDMRVKSAEEATKVAEKFEYLQRNPFSDGIKIEVTGGMTRPPMNPSLLTLELCQKVEEIAATLDISFQWQSTGGGSDGNFTAAMGIPTIDGMGPVGGRTHSVDEYMDVKSLNDRFTLLIQLLKDLA